MAENSTAVKKQWRQLFPNWENNNIENKPYLCEFCNERFQFPKAIRNHHKQNTMERLLLYRKCQLDREMFCPLFKIAHLKLKQLENKISREKLPLKRREKD